MTISDVISKLSESDYALDMLKYIIVKRWGDTSERIYVGGFDSFVNYVFDLDIHGWELVGFNKSKFPRYPDSYQLYIGSVYVEFCRKGY